MFANEKILEEYIVKIYEINPYFYKNYKEKIKTDKNGHEPIRFRIDVYFPEHNSAVEADEKGHTDRDLIFEKKRQEVLEKDSIVNLLELILIKKNMMYFMKLIEYKHLLVSLKLKN